MDYFSHVFVARCPEDPIFLFYFISCILLLFILFVAFFSGSKNNIKKIQGHSNLYTLHDIILLVSIQGFIEQGVGARNYLILIL